MDPVPALVVLLDSVTQVEFMDPGVMQQLTSSPALGAVAAEVRAKLVRVMDAL